MNVAAIITKEYFDTTDLHADIFISESATFYKDNIDCFDKYYKISPYKFKDNENIFKELNKMDHDSSLRHNAPDLVKFLNELRMYKKFSTLVFSWIGFSLILASIIVLCYQIKTFMNVHKRLLVIGKVTGINLYQLMGCYYSKYQLLSY